MQDSKLQIVTDRKSGKLALAGTATATAGIASLVGATPSMASVADVSTMVSSLGGLAAAALAVALVPMGIAFAFKIVRRVMA